ncbi:MAG TPA: hypothetical protein VN541_16690 [Tepidisphaeraceae bacterium]|nr:hypothetical protein [Tepidisphaeraceae bacterium]
MKDNPKLQRHSMFTITDIEPRRYAPGDWVTGWIYGFYFQALVFFEHAKNPDWEIALSRISKLELREPYHDRVIYSWDRGEDVPASEFGSQAAVEFLATHLADLVYVHESKRNKGTNAISSTSRGSAKSTLKDLFIRLMRPVA